MDANCTMNHEKVPKSIDRLRRAQNVSAQRKQITNVHNSPPNAAYDKYAQYVKYD